MARCRFRDVHRTVCIYRSRAHLHCNHSEVDHWLAMVKSLHCLRLSTVNPFFVPFVFFVRFNNANCCFHFCPSFSLYVFFFLPKFQSCFDCGLINGFVAKHLKQDIRIAIGCLISIRWLECLGCRISVIAKTVFLSYQRVKCGRDFCDVCIYFFLP